MCCTKDALGTPSKNLRKFLEELGLDTRIVELQKTTLLQSARVIRKVLEV